MFRKSSRFRSASTRLARGGIEQLELRQLLSANVLDSGFGGGGLIDYSYQMPNTKARGVAVQKDGKIVELFGNGTHGMAVRRFNTSGAIDKTFGNNGTAAASNMDASGYSGDVGAGILVQADGKIVVGGKSSSTFLVARLLSNGKPDTSFNGTGRATVFAGFSAPTCLLQQPDGKIVVAGGAYSQFAVARINTNGQLDNSFGSFGRFTTDIAGSAKESINNIALQADGKLVAAGSALTSSGKSILTLARYTTAGNADKSFDKDGIVQRNTPDNSLATQVAVQKDGKIVAGGSANGLAFVRFLASGALDN
jgi:uncharacterized delta-60 repeat protein